MASGLWPWKEAARLRTQDTTGSEVGSQAVSERRWEVSTVICLAPEEESYCLSSEGSYRGELTLGFFFFLDSEESGGGGWEAEGEGNLRQLDEIFPLVLGQEVL